MTIKKNTTIPVTFTKIPSDCASTKLLCSWDREKRRPRLVRKRTRRRGDWSVWTRDGDVRLLVTPDEQAKRARSAKRASEQPSLSLFLSLSLSLSLSGAETLEAMGVRKRCSREPRPRPRRSAPLSLSSRRSALGLTLSSLRLRFGSPHSPCTNEFSHLMLIASLA